MTTDPFAIARIDTAEGEKSNLDWWRNPSASVLGTLALTAPISMTAPTSVAASVLANLHYYGTVFVNGDRTKPLDIAVSTAANAFINAVAAALATTPDPRETADKQLISKLERALRRVPVASELGTVTRI